MPARDPDLPEGTDHIVNGAMKTRPETSAGADPTSGFVAPSATADDTGGTAVTDNRGNGISAQVREGIASLKGQAGERIRGAADEGKSKTSDALEELSRIVEEAAESIEERLGPQFSPAARRVAEAVGGFATTLRERDVDQLYEDVTGYVRRSPAVAIGIAAALGFVAIRLVKAGLPQAEESDDDDSQGGERKRRSSAKA
jgi:ElaB/YqjD/DUF883 family membrane-anchored ribosome-binding protein